MASVNLLQAQGRDNANLIYADVAADSAAPFQFHVQIPKGHEGEYISFRAKATDIDGNDSNPSAITRTLKIVADKPPSAKIIKPAK